ncbi:hypothetical protein ACFSTI_07600 [Rhizorhabdus histidinilytica]
MLTALLAASSSQIALAQIVAPETGQQIAPGRDELQDRTRQQPPPASRLKIEGDIERAPCALDRRPMRISRSRSTTSSSTTSRA